MPQYGQLLYRNLWQGINAKFYEADRQMKYDFIVAKGADPAQVQFYLQGANNLRVNAQGELEFETPFGTLQKGIPYTYQVINGKRVEVETAYQIEESVISFQVSNWTSGGIRAESYG